MERARCSSVCDGSFTRFPKLPPIALFPAKRILAVFLACAAALLGGHFLVELVGQGACTLAKRVQNLLLRFVGIREVVAAELLLGFAHAAVSLAEFLGKRATPSKTVKHFSELLPELPLLSGERAAIAAALLLTAEGLVHEPALLAHDVAEALDGIAERFVALRPASAGCGGHVQVFEQSLQQRQELCGLGAIARSRELLDRL